MNKTILGLIVGILAPITLMSFVLLNVNIYLTLLAFFLMTYLYLKLFKSNKNIPIIIKKEILNREANEEIYDIITFEINKVRNITFATLIFIVIVLFIVDPNVEYELLALSLIAITYSTLSFKINQIKNKHYKK